MRLDRRRDPARGAIALTALFFLLAMGAFLALSLNVGMVLSARTELQTAGDATALAAAAELNGTAAGIQSARRLAAAMSQQNQVLREPVTINASPAVTSDVRFGRWNESTRQFVQELDPETNAARVTAVQILNGATGGTGRNSPVRLFFMNFLSGAGGQRVAAEAVAVAGGPGRARCVLPLALANCQMPPDPPLGGTKVCTGDPDIVLTTVTSTFKNDKNDSIGFASLDASNVNTDDVEADIRSASECAEFSVGGNVALGNGANLNNQIIEALLGQGGSPCRVGTIETVAVVSPAGCDSGDPKFNKDWPLVTFARVRISQVVQNNGNTYTSCSGGPTGGGNGNGNGGGKGGNASGAAASPSITMEILCGTPNNTTAGGSSVMIGSARRMQLVR